MSSFKFVLSSLLFVFFIISINKYKKPQMNADERRFAVPGLRRGAGSLMMQGGGLGFCSREAQKISMSTTAKNAKVAKIVDSIL